MRIGYARVSTTEQNLDLQRDALKRAGCDKIIEDTASGGKVHRSGLERVRETLRSGDVLTVWRLDRLGRSLKHLIELMAELEGQGIGFQSVTESIDTTTPGGKLVFHIFWKWSRKTDPPWSRKIDPPGSSKWPLWARAAIRSYSAFRPLFVFIDSRKR